MNIKYLNVCLDKEQFVNKVIEKTMPKVKYKDEHVMPDRNIKALFIIAFVMLIFSVTNMLCGGSGNTFFDILLTIFWTFKCVESYVHYRKNNKAKRNNIIGHSLSDAMNECTELAKEYVSFDEIVTEPLFGNIDDVCHLIWIIYNTKIIDVKVKDGKIMFYYDYDGELLLYELDEFFDKGLTEYNTVSVTKDGVFLGMNNDVLKHAIKSIVLQQGIAQNTENET